MLDAIRNRIRLYNAKKELNIKELELSLKQYDKAIEMVNAIESEDNDIIDEDRRNGWFLLNSDNLELDEDQQHNMTLQANKLYHTNPFARAIIRNMVKFVLGKGPRIIPKEENKKDLILEGIKAFRNDNKFNIKEKEICRRLFRDGEFFIRFFDDKNEGKTRIRFIRPSYIRNPQDRNVPDNVTHGIKTNPDDIEDVISYYRCDKDGNYKEEIPAEEIMHYKIFSDSDQKRGVSLLRIAAKRLSQYEGWLTDRIVLNKVRSAIALVRTVSGTGKNVKSIRDENLSSRLPDNRQKVAMPGRGTIITASKGIEYNMLSPNINATDVRDDGRAMLLSISASIGFPEMILTADFCHDMKTEVLTDHGFMSPGKAAHFGFKLGTVNKKTGRLEYQKSTDWNFFNYDGLMYLFEGRRLNFMITRMHHVWTKPLSSHRLPEFRTDRSIDGFEKMTIGDVRRKFCAMRDFVELGNKGIDFEKTIKIARYDYPTRNLHTIEDSVVNKDRWFPIEDMIEFIGWFVSEGCVHETAGGFNICQSYVNSDYVKEIDDLLNRMEINYARVEEENLGLNTDTICYWRFNDQAVAGWLRVNCGVKSNTKHLPDFIWNTSNDLKEKLLQTLIKGDGTDYSKGNEVGYRRFYSESTRLINDVQRLAFELGYHATCNLTPKQKDFGYSVHYVDISNGHNCMVNTRNIERIKYSGPVWCATVPNGLLVTRRMGRILISGNSNANYASSLTAMNPFVREIEDWQDFFISVYKEIYERILNNMIAAGKLPENVNTECEIVFPPIIQADIDKLTKAFEILYKYRIVSRRTWRAKMDLDDEQERLYIQDEDSEDGGMGNPIFGQPAVPGQMPAAGQPTGQGKLNMPISPVNQYGHQLLLAVKDKNWEEANDLANKIIELDEKQIEE